MPILLLLASLVRGQPIPPARVTVSNVRLEADSNRVKIQYDVVGIDAADSVFIQVESRSGGILQAITVTGDVGRGILPGINKTVYWDYALDGVPIADDIQATVSVKPVTLTRQQSTGSGGAAYALLSALAPGLGTIFVQPGRKIGARPLLTVAYGGLLVYGLVQRGQSKKQYALYEAGRDEADYTNANQYHHQYLLAVRAAALILVADVVYTYLKGRKNDKARPVKSRRLFVDSVQGRPTLGVQLSF